VHSAEVRLDPFPFTEGARSYSTSTDETGAYEFTSVVPRAYQVEVSKPGFIDTGLGRTSLRGRIPATELKPGEVRDHADLALVRGGVISGRLVDESGEPFTGVQVSAVRAVVNDWQTMLVADGAAAGITTDGAGRFRIFGLRPGRYFVQATPISALQRGQRHPAYPSAFYPGTDTATAAGAVTVAAGQEASNIDFAVQPARTATASISGRIVTTSQPLGTSAVVSLVRRQESDSPTQANRLTRMVTQIDDFAFTFNPVAPGSYVILATAFGENGRDRLMAELPVVVQENQTLRNLVVTMATPTVAIHGRVRFESAANRTPAMSQVRLTIPAPDDSATANETPMPPGPDGTFVLAGLQSPRLLFRAQVPGWMVKRVTLNGVDVTDQPIDRPTATLDGLEIVLSDRLSHVIGTVSDSRGTVVPRVSVVVFADDPSKWHRGTRFIATGRSDEQGSVSIDGLPPGSYLAIAVADFETGMDTDRQRLADWSALATRLTLSEGGTQSIRLRMNP
jgi:hypothetical protein